MKYYFIAGEPSGNLHAVHLMEAVRRQDADAVIRYWYRPELAYMGFVSVVLHLPQILRGMADCKSDISAFAPDKLVLVDYPGFNLKIASWFWDKYIKGSALVRKPQVVYYIPPKIWAWKEKRIENIRRYVDVVLSILPFEVEWYRDNYGFHVDYVGNPTLDEISAFRSSLTKKDIEEWRNSLYLSEGTKVVALMPGSRRQEIERNLPMMLRSAMEVDSDCTFVIAAAPNIGVEVYEKVMSGIMGGGMSVSSRIKIAPCDGCRSSFMLMHNAYAAIVTSGTATLETAIMRVPQVVCYAMRCGKMFSFLRKIFLKVPYVSLVNLIVGESVVPELVAGDLSQTRLNDALNDILTNSYCRELQLQGYECLLGKLGNAGAPDRAAQILVDA